MVTSDDYDEIKYFLEYQFGQNLALSHLEHYHIDRYFSYPIHMADRGFQIGDHKMALHNAKAFKTRLFTPLTDPYHIGHMV